MIGLLMHLVFLSIITINPNVFPRIVNHLVEEESVISHPVNHEKTPPVPSIMFAILFFRL